MNSIGQIRPAIRVSDLSKTFQVPVRGAGLREALISLIRRETRDVDAVAGVNFEIMPGEMVGFLGPNGAGKTTTLKMLSGLLHPSGGECRVLDFIPDKRRKEFLHQITLVMGQRNQLLWDIPVIDSYIRNKAIYRLGDKDFSNTLDELTELLDLSELLQKPVRNLSLGERMKCEIAASLLHRPSILFLDEPTIGLDVTAQRRIREFLARYNKQTGATVLLTSHYMADVEALCKRVIVIHHGKILCDTDLSELVQQFSGHKTVIIELAEPNHDLSGYGEIIRRDGDRVTLRIPRSETPKATARILSDLPVKDLTVEDPPIEEVIESVFSTGGFSSDNNEIIKGNQNPIS